MSKKSAMERTLYRLRNAEWTAQKVEYWNDYARRRIDLFGSIDVVAVREGRPILAVQVCLQNDYHKNRDKSLDNDTLKLWVTAGGVFEVWAWSKRKVKRGGKAHRWHVTKYRLRQSHAGAVWYLEDTAQPALPEMQL